MIVIRIVALADGRRGHPAEGKWLESWDNDANDGRGEINATADLARAHRFTSASDAMQAWRATSKVRPTRPDGKPNRPLTAFTVEVLDETADPLL